MFFLLLLHFLPFLLLPYLLILCKKKEKDDDSKDEDSEKKRKEPKKVESKYKDPQADAIWKTRMNPSKLTRENIMKEFKTVLKIYEEHKCTNPEKSKTKDETCEICAAYMEWAGEQYDKSSYTPCPEEVKKKIEEDFFDYGGKLPECLEHPDWAVAKARLEKEAKAGGKKMPAKQVAAGAMTAEELAKYEQQAEAIRNSDQKLSIKIKQKTKDCGSVEYQTGLPNLKDEYEKVYKIYREHKCLGHGSREDNCRVCQAFVDWVEGHYKASLGEKSYPEEMKRKLEEHLYEHEGSLPSWMEKRDWARAKRRIQQKRQWPEDEKKLNATQKSEKMEEPEVTQKSDAIDVKLEEKPATKTTETLKSAKHQKSVEQSAILGPKAQKTVTGEEKDTQKSPVEGEKDAEKSASQGQVGQKPPTSKKRE